MRSRGGIPSYFPRVAVFVAVIMAFPLDIGVTGQYLYCCYRSVPQAPANVIFFLSRGRALAAEMIILNEKQSILLASPPARTRHVRGRRQPFRGIVRCPAPH